MNYDRNPHLIEMKFVTQCPDCGCTTVSSESRHSLHTCGDWNEYREFSCGYKVQHTPNFGKIQEVEECSRYLRDDGMRETIRSVIGKLQESVGDQ